MEASGGWLHLPSCLSSEPSVIVHSACLSIQWFINDRWAGLKESTCTPHPYDTAYLVAFISDGDILWKLPDFLFSFFPIVFFLVFLIIFFFWVLHYSYSISVAFTAFVSIGICLFVLLASVKPPAVLISISVSNPYDFQWMQWIQFHKELELWWAGPQGCLNKHHDNISTH